MATVSAGDLESAAAYSSIPAAPGVEDQPASRKRSTAGVLIASFVFTSLILLLVNRTVTVPKSKLDDFDSSQNAFVYPARARSRGVEQGVSEKVFRQVGGENLSFSWTNEMLKWQRTAYHFQPEKNWMNDPNGPLFHKGWYHLFYQYNPDSAVWGNITWGHAVSRDLIHWLHLPLAMVPDQSYDVNGVWTGSATILPDGKIIMLYTGDTSDLVQVQCVAYPANLSDPLLLQWVKHTNNPVLFPPPGIGSKDFRDPTTAWFSPHSDKWQITIGSKVEKTGVALVYETKDFINYKLLDEYMHQVPGTGMWECIDFYPVSLTTLNGLDTSVSGSDVKHVIKVSLDDTKKDHYSLGTYNPIENKWTPDNVKFDVGIGLRYDYGEYYASKTFYDHHKKRRILWGWSRETDAEELDLLKGWNGVQCVPRSVVFDQKTGTNLLQWPVEEVEALRSAQSVDFNDVKLAPGSITPLKVESPTQLDIVASFEIEKFETTELAEVGYDCSTSGGAANRGMFGPFGIVVLADDSLSEMTPIYFYISKGQNGKTDVHFCADGLRSSKAADVDKIIYGSKVPVLDDEKFHLRSLVDHSIVESFGQGGRTVISSRLYPTKAIGNAARVFAFNNATGITVTASVKIWKMDSADIRPFP